MYAVSFILSTVYCLPSFPHGLNISSELKVRSRQATIELLDDGNTLPFIARYRKEATGGLDEEQIRQVIELLEKLRTLDERRETILASRSTSRAS